MINIYLTKNIQPNLYLIHYNRFLYLVVSKKLLLILKVVINLLFL